VQSGHLHSVRGRGGGTFVAAEPPLASERSGSLRPDWREVLDLRLALETGAATLAAARADETTLEPMRGCVALMAAGPDFDDYRRADIRFHILLAQATGVPRLVALTTEVQAGPLRAHRAHRPPRRGPRALQLRARADR
jgi:DNA-binding FadR family transcriptional regulator